MNQDAINGIISAGVVAFGALLKGGLKGVKIGNFELNRLLPIFILIAAEVIHITYGYMIGENIVVSMSRGFTSTGIAVFGYDVAKSLTQKEKQE